jgi:hypothetical protein
MPPQVLTHMRRVNHATKFGIYRLYWTGDAKMGISKMAGITKLLEQAVDQARELPPEGQDAAADALFAHIANEDRRYRLSADQVEQVKQIRERLQSGETRHATEDETRALWKKCGLDT